MIFRDRMKAYILVGALALFVIAVTMMPASAATDTVTAMGTVIDERGQPVPGANVTLIDGNYHELGSATTDMDGNFQFVSVPVAGSWILKVKLSYVYDGKTYNNSLSDMQWYDGSSGLLTFDRNFTKLNDYPESDHGYVWGTVMNSPDNGRALDGTVYLINNTTTLTATIAMNGVYQIQAAPGQYEIYAVHSEDNIQMVSNRTKITITPSYSTLYAAPLILVADVITQFSSSTPVPTGSTFTVNGTVTDVHGYPLAGATVSLINDNFDTLATTTTDAEGNFKFFNVAPAGSPIVKVKVNYVSAGQSYDSSIENVRWNDASAGLVNIDPMDTRLYNYPPGDHGYVWGVVMDNLTSGRIMDSTVYLKNNTIVLSTATSSGSSGSFSFEVAPGDYEIYAVHGEGSDRIVSKHIQIHVVASNDILQSAPIDLIVDQSPGKPVRVLPLAAALALGVVLIIAGRVIFGRRQ
jgi:hypothetical protein